MLGARLARRIVVPLLVAVAVLFALLGVVAVRIANQFDLGRFVGKRVGVIGIADPESGTGYETVMVKRIEILADE